MTLRHPRLQYNGPQLDVLPVNSKSRLLKSELTSASSRSFAGEWSKLSNFK